MKSYLKWGALAVSLVCLVLVFQNCSIKSSGSSTSTSGKAQAYSFDAQDLIQVMESAGVVDFAAQNSLANPETLNLVVVNMTCSRLNTGSARQCVFKFKKEDGTYKTLKTTISVVDRVIQFLYASGVQCTNNCNDAETYTVSTVNCTKNINFPDQSQCSFVK
jgi:hypothetical protein